MRRREGRLSTAPRFEDPRTTIPPYLFDQPGSVVQGALPGPPSDAERAAAAYDADQRAGDLRLARTEPPH